MRGPLIITDIRLPQMDAEQMTPAMRRSEVRWHVLTVRVRNPSDVTPLNVIAEVHRIHYDASRRALLLHFNQRDLAADRPSVCLPWPPSYTVVGPGEEATLSYPISSPIAFIEQSPEGERQQYSVRLDEDVDTIECTVAYAPDPPPPAVDLTSRNRATPAETGAPRSRCRGSHRRKAGRIRLTELSPVLL